MDDIGVNLQDTKLRDPNGRFLSEEIVMAIMTIKANEVEREYCARRHGLRPSRIPFR